MNVLHKLWNQLVADEVRRKSRAGKEDPWRPKLHIAPPVGWLNDPNGLCEYQGVYHAFYQFAPFGAEGGLKFWGHAVSRDLLHWEYQGAPLSPDQPFDCHGVYSGSALAEEDGLYLYYTGNVKHAGDYDYVCTGRESNTVLAVSRDGMQAEKKELLMTAADYPEEMTLHVRDPKVWKQDGIYYMIQGARTRKNKGVALLFSSEDRRRFRFVRCLESKEAFGDMWECPDLYELDGKTVFAISPQGVEAKGLRYQNLYQSVTCFLDGDFRSAGTPDNFRELDGGFDFYAPQTFLSGDGRRIQIGWMGLPDVKDYTNPTVDYGWQHVLTLPRELSVKDGVLCQNPVRELAAWWNQEERFTGGFQKQTDSCYELEVENGGRDVRITIASGLLLHWDRQKKIFWMEFQDPKLGAGRTRRGREVPEVSRIRVLADVSCVEVFMNEGQDVFSTRYYPKEDQYRVTVEGEDIKGNYRSHRDCR